MRRTDLELRIEENLSLYSDQNNQKLIIFRNNKFSRSISHKSTFGKHITKIEKSVSCQNSENLIEQEDELMKIRQAEVCGKKNKLAIVPFCHYLVDCYIVKD